MTNEKARKIIKQFRDRQGNSNDDIEAFDMAIKALETQSCDCVSRKDVIILIDKATELHPYKVIGDSETYSNYNQGWEDACNWLYAHVESDNLKTVTPQRKVGKWKYGNGELAKKHESFGVYCSECDEWSEYSTDYCPNCGAKMEEDNEK